MIDISDLNEADVLAALYNASRPLGLGHLHFTPEPMMRKEAAVALQQQRRFDYLNGRVMKVSFFDESRREVLDYNMPGHLCGESLYDRDNGEGATARVITELRASVLAPAAPVTRSSAKANQGQHDVD